MRPLADRYELIELVGEGGMSVVWRAHDNRLGREVAVKLLRPLVAGEPDQRRRFNREARTLAGLSNDRIVRVFDYAESGDDAFLVMEFVTGGNLAAATFGRLPLRWDEAAAYLAPVADALAYAHAKAIIHRDLTPANILIENDSGRVVVSDFGLARVARTAGTITAAGVLIGTPEYWSPEQAQGHDNSSATDMYALGCILYLLLTGHLPFEGEDRLATGLRRAHEDAPSLRVHAEDAPKEAVALADVLLVRDPSGRPAAAAARAALAKAAGDTKPAPVSAGVLTAKPDALRRVVRTVVITPEKPTVQVQPEATALFVRARPIRRHHPNRWLAAALCACAASAGVFAFERLRGDTVHAPNVVALRADVAQALFRRLTPAAYVSVVRVYSTRVRQGRVIRQRPLPSTEINKNQPVTLVVSKGSPFADVPLVAAGSPAAAALASLEQNGFRGRLRYTPSWTTRKGTVIAVQPVSGTRLHRPAAVRIVVASGYPREVVPNVQKVDFSTARSRLEGKHLRYEISYQLSPRSTPGQVVAQSPRPGAVVYKGSPVRITVTRTYRWVKLFANSGSDNYLSDPFTVQKKWRIRYSLAGSDILGVVTQFAWAKDGSLFADGSFFAYHGGSHTYTVAASPGRYRVAVNPYSPGTRWHVEVDTLE